MDLGRSFPMMSFNFYVLVFCILHFTFYALPSSVDVDVVGRLGCTLESGWAIGPNSADFVRAEVEMPAGGTRSRATLYAFILLEYGHLFHIRRRK